MNWQTIAYFSIILVTFVLTGFLAWYVWRHPPQPGVRAFALLAAAESMASMVEMISMVSTRVEQVQFWFNVRFLFIAFLPVIFLVFAVRYNGHGAWFSRGLIALLCLVPVATQFMVWTNPLYHLWVERDVLFNRVGPFWIAAIGERIPALWFIVHSFYSLLLMLAGIVVILITAWGKRREFLGQSLLLSAGALVGMVVTSIPTLNLLPNLKYNIFIPGLGVSTIFYAAAVLRFKFLIVSPISELQNSSLVLKTKENRPLALFWIIFSLLVTGIGTIGFLSYKAFADHFQQQAVGQLRAVAELKVNGLSEWRDDRMNDAQAIAQNDSFALLVEQYLASPIEPRASQLLQDWLDTVRLSYGYDRVFFLDVSGVQLASSPVVKEPGKSNLIDQMQSTFQSSKTAWLDFHFDEDYAIHLCLLTPIFSGSNPLGVLVLDIDTKTWLYPYLEEWPIVSDTSETLLVRQDGKDALFLNPVRFNPDSALYLRVPLSDTEVLAVKGLTGEFGILEGTDYRGTPVIGAVLQVPDSPWILVAKMDKSEVYAPLQERLWKTFVFFGILIITAGNSMALIWRRNRVRYYQAQVQAADALRESEEKFRNAFMISTDGVAITRLSDGMVVSTNIGYEKILGYSAEEAVGRSSIELAIWADPLDRETFVKELQKTGSVQNFEAEFRTKSGDQRYGLMSAAVIDINGEKHILNTTRDITDLKTAEATLRESEKRYRLIAENTADVIWIMDVAAQRFTYVSPSVVKLRGYTPEEVLSQSMEDALTPESGKKVRDLLELGYSQFLSNGSAPLSFIDEVDQPCKDGSIVPTEVTISFLLNDFGKLEIIGISRDITARRAAEKVLQEYSEQLEEKVGERTRELHSAQERLLRQERLAALGQLAGSIAHELRNPLGVIANAATYLEMIQPDADQKVREYIDIIQGETRTSEKIITELLDFTRLQVVERKPAEISTIIKNAVTRNPAPGKIDLMLDIHPDLPLCFVNATQIEQVLGNLITNAYQAMPAGGDLRVRAEIDTGSTEEGEKVKISVKDTGEGISPENLQKIFEPLFTTKIKGIGLGLAVCKKLIEANHGLIEVESQIGHGSTFTIYLPVNKEAK